MMSQEKHYQPLVIRDDDVLGTTQERTQGDVTQDHAGCDSDRFFSERGSSSRQKERQEERSRSLGTQGDSKVSSSSKSSPAVRSVAKDEGSLETLTSLCSSGVAARVAARVTTSSSSFKTSISETRDADTTPDDEESNAISRQEQVFPKTKACINRLHCCCSSCHPESSLFMEDVSRHLALIMKRLDQMNHRLQEIEGRLFTQTDEKQDP